MVMEGCSSQKRKPRDSHRPTNNHYQLNISSKVGKIEPTLTTPRKVKEQNKGGIKHERKKRFLRAEKCVRLCRHVPQDDRTMKAGSNPNQPIRQGTCMFSTGVGAFLDRSPRPCWESPQPSDIFQFPQHLSQCGRSVN
ncbi:hypothetical protein J6590_061224 [Homalodisca vitripennis]|nr:hypothetical protein J6590_061224 [Homalodisca vitripennis]